MSGFEVAGIVLGSIPLAISALEHYGEGLSTIQRWRKYKRELQSLVRNLQTERVKLQNVCEKLLVGIVPPSDIEAMIDDPLGGLWRQDAVQKRIQFRLWKSYDVFEATISDIKVAIDEIKAEIDSQRDGNVSELRRGIFTLKRSRYDDQLSTIRNGVSNLENLTDRNIELEPERRVRSQTKLFTVLRDMATSFHRALRSGFRCSCKHDVGLGRYSIHPAPDSNDSHSSWSLVSLREILEHKALFPPLSYRDRLRLAVTISSSVLQLHGTPWLPTILTSRHIYFIRKPDSPTMYWYPILLKQHHPPLEGKDQLEPVNDCGGTTTGSSIMAERNPTLLSLGCVLIEVILGRTLDQSRGGGSPNRQDVGVDLMSDYVAAQSLMDEVRMKSLNYEAAMARCVDDGKLHRHDRGLEDVDLCQDVYSRVVALLEKDLETS